uniref:Uncharacterized protein n=1 Tax=Panagrolaimus superbus TaxID=310955 RepID=A0A914YUB0_9BILA
MLKTLAYPIKPCSSRIVATSLKQHRPFSAASDNNMPEMYHLEHVQKRLEHTVPFMFRQRLDFTFYHRDVYYDNQILNMQDHGLDSYMKHLGRISVAGQLAMPYIKMAPLSINLIREDGSVRLRWRVAYLSWLDSLNFKNFKAEYRDKNARWYDGNAIFYVGADGLVYKVIIQKLTPDDSFTQKSTKKLVEKIGILPQGTANFVPANSKKKESTDV